MDKAYRYLPSLSGRAPVTDFAELIPTADSPYPIQEIRQFLTVGPFVLKTDDAMETEFFYERDKVLSCDYLAADGGEASVRPVLGQRVHNHSFYGPEELCWQEGLRKWGALRIDGDEEAFHDAFSATVQGNCVFYAATYICCCGEQLAIISYEDSGSLLFLNGELVDDQPYGRVKSLVTLGHQVAVRFRDGLNLLLFKVRSGYLADSVDLSISFMAVHPVMLTGGALGVTHLMLTGAYVGRGDDICQTHYVFAGAFGREARGELCCTASGRTERVPIEPLASGEVRALRVGVPLAKDSQTLTMHLTADDGTSGEADFTVRTGAGPVPGIREHVFSDFHFDTTYHLEQRTYAIGALHITGQMVRTMRENPQFRAILSEVDYLHPYYSLYPQDRELLRRAFRTRQAEADCLYNQPNELTSSPEAITRNLIYGQKYHMEYFGQPALVYSPGDVFGHPNQMSQICAKGECLACRWNKTIIGLDNLFRHMSPDGTCLTHNRGFDMADAKRYGVEDACHSSCLPNTYPPYPANDSSWQKDSASQAACSLFSVQSERYEESRERFRNETGKELIRAHSRDLTQHHSGVLLTRSDFKQANRMAENLLVTAEKLSVITGLYGADYPERALDKAWRQLLCGQHHDSITGTNNEISFIDLMLEYREAVELAEDIIDGAMMKLASQAAASGEHAVMVFNPHPWERRAPIFLPMPEEGGCVSDSEGNTYPIEQNGYCSDGTPRGCFVAPVPALGYRCFELQASAISVPDKDAGNVIENEYFRLTVAPERGGGIVSLWDKHLQREWIEMGEDGPANRVAVLREVPDRCETQHEFYTTGQKMFSSEMRANVRRVIGKGFQRLDIVTRLDVIAVLRQSITLWQGVPRVDMETVIEDYQSRDDLFAVTFPINVKGGIVTYDDRYAPHVTGKSLNKISFQTHQFINYSFSHVNPVNQWLDLGSSARVSMGEAEAFGIGMTAIVQCSGVENEPVDALMEVLTRQAIPVTIYPDGQQRESAWLVVHFNEDIAHTDTRFVLSLSDKPSEYADKLKARLTDEKRAAFEAQLREHGVATMYAVDADNALGKSINVLLVCARSAGELNRWAKAASADLKERLELRADNAVQADMCATCDNLGAALINNGNIACSVEGDNLMTMMLFHTADFYGNAGRTTGDRQLIPEQKTFHASYALYPHAGSWREADVYRRAMEFNDPPIARAFVPAGHALPAEHSYLTCPEGFILTCMKAGGFDMASFRTPRVHLAERGIALRGFECTGAERDIAIQCGFGVNAARRVNLLEHGHEVISHDLDRLCAHTSGFSIETFVIEPEMPKPCLSGVLASDAEPVQPVYVRSWEQDRGSMPMGYLSLAGFIDRKVERPAPGEWQMHVHISNNSADAPAKGKAHLTASEGLICDTKEIEYSLAAGEAGIWPIAVYAGEKQTGILRLEYDDGHQRMEDVLELADNFKPEMLLEDRGEAIVATVTNRTEQWLSGELQLASPIETWGNAENANGMMSIAWKPVPVALQPGESREYAFPVKEPENAVVRSFWATGRLVIGSHIVFAYTTRRQPLHAHHTNEFEHYIHEDGGSLQKLFHLNDLPDIE